MTLDKKQLKAEYRDRALDAGVLLISFASSPGCTGSADSADSAQQFLLPARDIKSTQNRLRFMLELQNCTYKELQTAWDTYGEQSLHFELTESYKPNSDDANSEDASIEEDLRTLLHLVAQDHPQATVLEPARL